VIKRRTKKIHFYRVSSCHK